MDRSLSKDDRQFLASRANSIRETAKRTVEGIVFIGQWLTECKERLPHGQWLPWLETEFGWRTAETARKLMRVYECLKSQQNWNLQIDVSALYLLSAPNTPEPIREEVIRRAETGERITHAVVMELVHFPTTVVDRVINIKEIVISPKETPNIHTLKQQLARDIHKILRPDDPLVKRLDEVITCKDDLTNTASSDLAKTLEVTAERFIRYANHFDGKTRTIIQDSRNIVKSRTVDGTIIN